MTGNKTQRWVDDRALLVNSWWGAFAALILLQAYSFILLQGLAHFTTFVPVTLVFLLVIMLSQAGSLRVMNQYLKTRDWKTAIRFWHSPIETLKFCAAIVSAAVYWYLLTGHRPFPADSALYREIGIFGNLMFQLANLAVSSVLNRIWKLSPQLPMQTDGHSGAIAVLVAIPLGILLVIVSCYATELFYIIGVICYGMIVLALSAALTRDSRS